MAKRKLLLADDSMTIQKVVNLTFADEGIEVVTVGSGTAAVEKLEEIEPDLVLADVHMPGLNGYEVCERIRQNPRFADIPVMLLVGSFEPFDEAEARRVGANDFLTKPFQSIRQLVQKVTTLLDAPKTSAMNGTPAIIDEPEQTDFAQTAQIAAPFTANFGDAGMDDEMIETSSGGSFEPQELDSGIFENLNPYTVAVEEAVEVIPIKAELIEDYEIFEADFEEDGKNQSENELPVMRPTTPLSFADIQEINYSMLSPLGSTAQSEQDALEVEAEIEPKQQSETAEFDFDLVMNESETAEPVYEIDASQFDNDSEPISQEFEFAVTEMPAPNSATGNLILELSDNAPFAINEADDDMLLDLEIETEFDAPFPSELKTEAAMQIVQTNQTAPATQQIGQTNRIEQTTDFEILPPSQSNVGNALAAQILNQQPAADFNQPLSDDVIERIAERVVEKISDKVIERIAWEIVPDRFDLIVKKHLQNRTE